MSPLKIGMKMVCIKDGLWFNPLECKEDSNGPRKDDILTIRDIVVADLHGHIGLAFIEGRWFDGDGTECYYSSTRFMPLVSESDSIAMFRKLVEPSAVKRARETVE